MTPFRIWMTALLAVGLSLLAGLWMAGQRPDTTRMITRTLDATLLVQDENGAFLGSALLWQGGEIAVTNAHVLKGKTDLTLMSRDGSAHSARLERMDPARDIALLRLDHPAGTGLSVAPEPPIGAPVYATGAPLEATFTVTRGIVSARRQVLPAVPVAFVQHDAAINPGSSGGPLVDAAGRLVAMNTRIADGSRFYVGVSYAIPAGVIARMIAGDLPPVTELGLAARPLTPMIAHSLSVPGQTGLLIDDVAPGSTADAAGLRPGDILTRLDEQRLTTNGDLSMALATATSTPRLTVLREGKERDVPLALAAPAIATARVATARDNPGTNDLILPVDARGTVLTLDETDPAYAAGLTKGDVILAIDGQPFYPADHTIRPPALLQIRRDQRTTHILLPPDATGLRPRGGGNQLDPAVTLF